VVAAIQRDIVGQLQRRDHPRGISPALRAVCVCVCRAADVRKVAEFFTRMFHDPQSKVFTVFAETLVDFVAIHADDLSHWLPILLPRLFLKLVSDIRGSIYTKVEKALQAVRWLAFAL